MLRAVGPYLPAIAFLIAAVAVLALSGVVPVGALWLLSNGLYVAGAAWWTVCAVRARPPLWPHLLGLFAPAAPPTLFAWPLLRAGDGAVMGVFPIALALLGSWLAVLLGLFVLLLRTSWSRDDKAG